MKLYELPRNTQFVINEQPKQPPDMPTEVPFHKEYTLHNVDGMYSYVTDKDNNVYHFAAWTEVTPIELPVSNQTTLQV